ncbi:MAG: hypothetical protein AAF438_07070 [Pseudomonadota bacterium]
MLKKGILIGLGTVGSAIFIAALSLTYSTPAWIESFASEYIEREATKKLDDSIDAIQPSNSGGALARLAQTVYDSNEERIDGLKESLRANVHGRLAAAYAEIRNLDCECRKKTEKFLKEGFETNILLLQAANDKVVDFIQYKYMDVLTELKRDIRIFAATNAIAFLLLLVLAFLKPNAMTHLFVPGILLAISTIVCSYFYIFEQNWLLTIIHSEYLGFAYLGWLGFVFLFFCDIVLNRGRVTTEIINGVLNAIGSAASVVPC